MFRSHQRIPHGSLFPWLFVLMPMLVLLLAACAASDAPADDSPSDPAATPIRDAQVATSGEPRTIKLGVAPGRRPGQTPIDALIDTEQLATRRFDVLRAYAFWDGEFPDLRHQWASEAGQTLHLSINARRTDGSVVSWQEIATADDDDPVHQELQAWVERLASFGGPLRVTFHHEADIEPEFGSPADFVDAWRRFATLLDEQAPDVETAWVLTAFNLDKPLADQFWPGDEYVDLIGADAFNWFGCRGTPEAWRSPREVLAPLITFGQRHPTKPLILAELGSDEDSADPGRKSAWLNELTGLLQDDEYQQLDTIVFFHNDHDADSTCDWWIDSSDDSADAFARLASAPLFGGDEAVPPIEQCPVIAMVTSMAGDQALVDGDGDGRFDFEFGDENRFLGIGDQSADGADHRVVLRFDPLGEIPADASLELRIRVGERQPLLSGPVELRLLEGFDIAFDEFSQPGEVLEPEVFNAVSPGGHHVIDLTDKLDPRQSSTLRLQLASAPPADDGRAALFVGMGEASRSIDRPALIARRCE